MQQKDKPNTDPLDTQKLKAIKESTHDNKNMDGFTEYAYIIYEQGKASLKAKFNRGVNKPDTEWQHRQDLQKTYETVRQAKVEEKNHSPFPYIITSLRPEKNELTERTLNTFLTENINKKLAPADQDCINLALILAAGNGYDVGYKKSNEGFIKDDTSTGCVTWLLDNGADQNAQVEGISALMMAAMNGHRSICEKIITKINHLDYQGVDQYTALMLAAKNGHKSIVAFLHEQGSKLETTDSQGNTALMLAARYAVGSRSDLVSYLIEKGVDVNTSNKNGQTALKIAVRYKAHGMINTLLQHSDKLHFIGSPITYWPRIALYKLINYKPEVASTPQHPKSSNALRQIAGLRYRSNLKATSTQLGKPPRNDYKKQ